MSEGLNSTALHTGGAAIATTINHISTHTGTPDGTGSAIGAAGKVACTMTDTGGVITLSAAVDFTGGAANETVAAIGYWNTTTWLGYNLIGGGSDTTYNAAGEYTVDSVTITGAGS